MLLDRRTGQLVLMRLQKRMVVMLEYSIIDSRVKSWLDPWRCLGAVKTNDEGLLSIVDGWPLPTPIHVRGRSGLS